MTGAGMTVKSSAPVAVFTVNPFNYAALEPAVASGLRSQADRIKGRITKTTEDIIEIGRDLLASKQHLDHGQFRDWVEAEIGIVARSAQRYMAAAQFAEGKSDTVTLLKPATVYRLAAKSASPEVVTEIVKRASAGVIVPDSVVVEMLSDAQFRKRQDKRAELKQSRRGASKRCHDARERQQQELEAAKATRQVHIERVAAALIEDVGADHLTRVVGALTPADTWDVLDVLRTKLGVGGPT